MLSFCRIRLLFSVVILASLASGLAQAEGGLSIQGTRIVYPQGAKQVSVSLMNSSTTDSFLVQSWVEDATGKKSPDFIVTPPLYLSGPKNENIVRVMYAGGDLPTDHESLYYFIEKAIPSLDKSKIGNGNVLLIAAANRIKLFIRPKGLLQDVNSAANTLRFDRVGNKLQITNSSPYYLTLTDIIYNHQEINSFMIAPKSQLMQTLPVGSDKTITYHYINDFGGTSDSIKKNILP